MFSFTGDLPQSFGLHSPDQLPSSEQDYHKMATSFGLHSPDQIPPDMYNAVYDPRLFCDGGLYLDPDIIGESNVLCVLFVLCNLCELGL